LTPLKVHQLPCYIKLSNVLVRSIIYEFRICPPHPHSTPPTHPVTNIIRATNIKFVTWFRTMMQLKLTAVGPGKAWEW